MKPAIFATRAEAVRAISTWIALGAAFLALCFAVWWLLTEPGRQARKATVARTEAAAAGADARASDKAAEAIGAAGDRAAERAEVGRQNRDEILSQPGASNPIDPGVGDAGLRSLCRRDAYRNSADCLQLRTPDPGKAAR